MFFAFFAQKIFWKPKPVGHRLRRNHLSVSGYPCAAACEAEPRSSRRIGASDTRSLRGGLMGRGEYTERVTEEVQGKNWRNGARTETIRQPGRLLWTHFRQQQIVEPSVSPPSIATSNQRVQCKHTKPHLACSLPSNRARRGDRGEGTQQLPDVVGMAGNSAMRRMGIPPILFVIAGMAEPRFDAGRAGETPRRSSPLKE
jgi:hypothetical protein